MTVQTHAQLMLFPFFLSSIGCPKLFNADCGQIERTKLNCYIFAIFAIDKDIFLKYLKNYEKITDRFILYLKILEKISRRCSTWIKNYFNKNRYIRYFRYFRYI